MPPGLPPSSPPTVLEVLQGLRIAPTAPRRRPSRPPPPRATADGAPAPGSGGTGWLWDRGARPLSRQALRQANIRPKKSLGQNFMADESVLEDIAAAAALSPGDPVLEIGPGTGALTAHLLAAGAAVTAVEKDRELAERLTEQLEARREAHPDQRCRLVTADVLRLRLPDLFEEMLAEGGGGDARVQVVANLPYYITKDFLVRALPQGDRAGRLLLMLQHEVAERLCAGAPGGPDWRAMNILVHYYSAPRYLFKIDRAKYVPAPKVHGAVAEFRLRRAGERAAVPDERAFVSLVKRAFLQRRKALRNSLQPLVSSGEAAEALAAAGLSPDARAQELGLQEFVALAWEVDRIVKGRPPPEEAAAEGAEA